MKIMMKWLSVMIFSLLMSTVQADDLFNKANAFYEAGQSKEAVETYEEIYQANGPQVGILQNLGSAYYRLGDNARAILAFERALILKPKDPDLLANLKLTQEAVAIYPLDEDKGVLEAFAENFSVLQWSKYALSAAILLPFLSSCMGICSEEISLG